MKTALSRRLAHYNATAPEGARIRPRTLVSWPDLWSCFESPIALVGQDGAIAAQPPAEEAYLVPVLMS